MKLYINIVFALRDRERQVRGRVAGEDAPRALLGDVGLEPRGLFFSPCRKPAIVRDFAPQRLESPFGIERCTTPLAQVRGATIVSAKRHTVFIHSSRFFRNRRTRKEKAPPGRGLLNYFPTSAGADRKSVV